MRIHSGTYTFPDNYTAMNILITGALGQLGMELRHISGEHSNMRFTYIDKEDLDLTNQTAVNTYFDSNRYDAVIHCAAYTAVDKAETEKDMVYAVNRDACLYLAKACAKQEAVLVQISTDFVFDGSAGRPYKEEDLCAPLSIYGWSKMEGEEAVRLNNERHYIIRTSWLYSNYGNNFVKTMTRLGRERKQLSVVFDQIGTPTYARDLAHAILHILDSKKHLYGTYHYSNEGVCSWFDFAHYIMKKQGIECEVLPIETHQYPTPAKRPAMSVLHKGKIRDNFQLSIPHWSDSLDRCLSIAHDL